MIVDETITEKLQKVLATKSAIRDAILDKGGTLHTDRFDAYPDAILTLPNTRPPVQRSYYFGYDMNTADSNPATCISYPEDVDNAHFSKAVMNFGGAFDYGGWPSTPGSTFMPKPCMLKYDCTVDYYLDPNDYGTKEAGGASDIANVDYGGNAMMEWPKIYTKRWQDGDIYHFRCSDAKLDSEYECWCNYDANDQEIDHFYTAIYTGSTDTNGRLRSLSGADPTVSVTFGAARAQAGNNQSTIPNTQYEIDLLSDLKLIQDLLIMMFKSTNLRATAGFGVSDSSLTAPISSGTMNTKGLFWGARAGKDGVKVFGMENYWGNIYRWINGWITIGREQYVKLTRGTKDGSTTNSYNETGDGYIHLENCTLNNDNVSTQGYIKTFGCFSHGIYPISLLGSDASYIPDLVNVIATSNTSSVSISIISGLYSQIGATGPFRSRHYIPASTNNDTISASLSCKPLAQTSS